MTGKGTGNQSGNGKSWGKYGASLYKHWVDNYSHNHVNRWLKKHKFDINSTKSKEFVKYMTDGFIDWINRDR